MAKICWYLQLHQPWRLADFSVFDLNQKTTYFQDQLDLNRQVFNKVAAKSYRPMLSLLLKLLNQQPNFHFTLSASGVFLEQAQKFAPDLIGLLQKLVATGRAELLAETY